MFSWLPWYAWVPLIWVIIASILALIIGRVIRLRERDKKIDSLDERIAERWRSPRDKEWRERWK